MGLLGSTHCAGMCGGIVSALSLSIAPEQRNSSARLSGILILYNIGRILSYTIAGWLIASLGSSAADLGSGIELRRGFVLLSALVMIALGLYLTGWWSGAILAIEKVGALVWSRISPLANSFIPLRTMPQALIAGMLWGWLPCGLVYTALIWTLSASSSLEGALIMATFGVGTLPAMLSLGYISKTVIAQLQRRWVRQLTGTVVIGFGVMQLLQL